MNKLQKAAGLLNDKAPENHFLAYINPKEAGLLKSVGASGKMTPQGILSFEPADGYAGEVSSDYGGYGGGGYSDNTDSEENQPSYSAPTNNTSTNVGGSDIDMQYTVGNEFDVTVAPEDLPSVLDYAIDEYRNKNIINQIGTAKGLLDFSSISPFTTGANLLFSGYRAKAEAEKAPDPVYAGGEDGYGEGNYVSTVGDWAESRGLTEDYSSEDLESQVVLDQAAFDAGFRSQDFKDYYSGESIDIQNLNTPEINLVRQLIPQAPGLMSGEELPTSVFETFFGKSIGIMGNDIMDRYETAKQNVATTIASPQTSFASYGIFQDARNRGII